MENDPNSMPAQEDQENPNITPVNSSFTLKVCCMILVIITSPFSIATICAHTATNCGTSEPDTLTQVDTKKEVIGPSTTEVMLILGICILVEVLCTLDRIGALERFATRLKLFVNETFNCKKPFNLLRLLLIAVGIVGIMLGYLEVQPSVVFTSFSGILIGIFMSIDLVEYVYKEVIDAKEEKGLGDDAKEEKGLGGDVKEEKGLGDDAMEEKGLGGDVKEEKGLGGDVKEENGLGDDAKEEKGLGDDAKEEKELGGDAKEEKGLGDDAKEEKELGDDAKEEKGLGGDVKEEKGLGGDVKEEKGLGGDVKEEKGLGDDAKEEKELGEKEAQNSELSVSD